MFQQVNLILLKTFFRPLWMKFETYFTSTLGKKRYEGYEGKFAAICWFVLDASDINRKNLNLLLEVSKYSGWEEMSAHTPHCDTLAALRNADRSALFALVFIVFDKATS